MRLLLPLLLAAAAMHAQVHEWSFAHFPDAEHGEWYGYLHRDGSLSQKLHVLEGLDQAPVALGMLFRGENSGKLVVRVAD